MENEILIGIVSGIVCLVFGWGVSQLSIGRKLQQEMSKLEINIERVVNDEHRNQDETAALRVDITSRTVSLNSLIVEMLKVCTELIQIVKVQNEILNDRNKR